MGSSLDLPDRVTALHERGLALAQQGRPGEADRTLAEALALLDARQSTRADADLRARILITRGYVDLDLHGFEAATARLDLAADLIERHHLVTAHCVLHLQRGLLLLQTGQFEAALAEFALGADGFPQAPARDRVSLLINRAVAWVRVGSLGRARADLVDAVSQAQASGLAQQVAKATHNLGFVDYLAGDLPSALRSMNAAEAMDPELAPAVSLLSRAQVLVCAGLLIEADEAFATAATGFARDRHWSFVPETELERARCAAARGDIALTRRLASSALVRFRELGHDAWRCSAEQLLLQAELADPSGSPDLDGLLDRAQRLHRETATLGLTTARRETALIVAEVQLAGRALAAAARTVASTDPTSRADPIASRMRDHHVRARVAAATGDRRGAVARIRRALDELARYQASFGSVDLRTASAVHGRRLADLDVTLALRSGHPASVFAAAERARASSSRLTPVQPPADAQSAALLGELRRTVEELRAGDPGGGISERLTARRRRLEREVRARSWALPGGGRPARPESLPDARVALQQADRAMLVLLGSQSRLYAVSIADRVTVHELGPTAPVVESLFRVRADLDVSARPGLPAAIRAAVDASLARSLARLDATLAPALPVPARGGLVVVTTGVLSGLPWGLLPSLRGVPVTVAPSATKWVACLGASLPTAAPRVVAVAGPDVAWGDREAGAVARLWAGASTVTGSDATVAGFGELAASCDVLHVAAHGFHQSESPLFSSLRMADGSVFAHDLTVSPGHVVLSACQVGMATVRPGDEALGLASALLHLGARSVIASAALVADDLAARTMMAYHHRLAAGSRSDEALAATLAEVDAPLPPPFVELGAGWQAT